MIGNARQSERLYYLVDRTKLGRQTHSTCVASISISTDNEIML